MAEYTKEQISEWQLKNKVLTGLIKRSTEKSINLTDTRNILDQLNRELESIVTNHECQKYFELADGRHCTSSENLSPTVAYCLGLTDEIKPCAPTAAQKK